MNLEHKMIDGTAMVSYLRERQSNLKIGSPCQDGTGKGCHLCSWNAHEGGRRWEILIYMRRVRSVPDSAKKTIKGGRTSGMTDINPMWQHKSPY